MGLCLIATGWLDAGLWLAVLEVAVGLGMVIFVHELGHFAVAKMCGVKCEKFYLGFDIGGLKLCKLTWGETEYGIGILPLGGYVKMLGQEDNPARLREEVERARQKPAAAEASLTPPVEPNTATAGAGPPNRREADKPQADEMDVEAAKQALFDPRSYLAQSVPKRMAIISAGVIMNLVFAFVTAAIAFGLGVRQISCGVGQVMPGEAAWQANFKVGDQIVRIADQEVHKFRDLQAEISLGDDLEKGIPILVRRPGEDKLLSLTVMPDKSGLLPRIGIGNPWTTTLSREDFLAWPGSAVERSRPAFQLGDKIIKIDGEAIENYAQLHAHLARHVDQTLKVTVERPVRSDGNQAGPADSARPKAANHRGRQPASWQVTIHVAPNPMRRLGLVMEMGRISAVQADSPGARAGIRTGDKIVLIDGKSPGDPMTLPDRLRWRAGQTITLILERETDHGRRAIPVQATLRPADRYETPMAEGNPVAVPALGIAYHVGHTVHAVIPKWAQRAYLRGTKQHLRPGDVITKAKIIPPPEDPSSDFPLQQSEISVEFSQEKRNWPLFIYALQEKLPGTTVQLQWRTTGGEPKTATLEPVRVDDWFNPDRGFVFEPVYFDQTAGSLGEAVRWGAEETLDSTLLVYRFLQKLGTQQVSPRALGGPWSIFKVAMRAAEMGTSDLLIFLTLLSANLAVINFLPIPLLDGGHMVLLAWEGVRGKPADERVQLVLTYIGLMFILTLMAWVIGLDVGLIPRH